MSVLAQALALFSEPPGSLVYHVVLLYALQAATVIAAGHWWRERGVAEARLALAAGGALLLRLCLLIVGLLAFASLLDPFIAVPPLDRAVSTLTILLIVWMCVFPEPRRLADAICLSLAALILFASAAAWPAWQWEAGAGAKFYSKRSGGITLMGSIANVGDRLQPGTGLD